MSRTGVFRCLTAFEEGGFDGLLERKKPPVRPSPIHDDALVEAVGVELEKGTFRTAVQAQAWLLKNYGIDRALPTLYRWLKKCGAALLVPRPVHIKKNQQLSEAFPEWIAEKLPQLPLTPGRRVRVWFQDESRIGLHTIVRRAWGKRGRRLVKKIQKKYKWAYIYGALELGTGQIETLMMSHVNLESSEAFLRYLAQTDPEAEHVVIWDGAGFHQKEGKHVLPERVHVIQLPPYSPELNPIEKLWDILKDGLCNRIFESLEDLWDAVCQELQGFYENANKVIQLIGNSETIASVNASSKIL
jgi:transposase